jgi:hypothetical protein
VRLVILLAVASAACGTYSMVRPARTLPAHEVEVAAGLAASSLEVNTIGHVAYGVTDRVELLAQNEIWNTFGEARYAIARRGDAPLDVTIGAGGGTAVTLLSAVTSSGNRDSVSGLAGTLSFAIGRELGRVSITAGNRTFVLAAGYLASSTRAAIRIRAFGKGGVFVEAGATYHALLAVAGAGLVIGEGAGGIFLGF